MRPRRSWQLRHSRGTSTNTPVVSIRSPRGVVFFIDLSPFGTLIVGHFADCGATTLSGVVGTSNIVTVVESSAGIAAGGRTGLTSAVVAICFALSALFAPLASAIPTAATAPVLVVVGCMMMSAFGKIRWEDISDTIPAFSASALMAFTYSITYGVAAGFITYCLVKTVKREARDAHPIMWAVAVVFIVDLAVVHNLL